MGLCAVADRSLPADGIVPGGRLAKSRSWVK